MYMWGYAPGRRVPAPGPGAVRQPGRHRHGGSEQHARRARVDHVPRAGKRAGQRRAGAAAVHGAGTLTSLTNVAACRAAASPTASWPPTRAATSTRAAPMPQKQVRMGLFGALVVRPTMGANFAYNRADSQYTPTEEFMVLLSEIDPYQHQAAEFGRRLQPERLPAALLADQRPRVPRLDRRQLQPVPARPAVRRAGAHNAV